MVRPVLSIKPEAVGVSNLYNALGSGRAIA
jgi:hypothetical protein